MAIGRKCFAATSELLLFCQQMTATIPAVCSWTDFHYEKQLRVPLATDQDGMQLAPISESLEEACQT